MTARCPACGHTLGVFEGRVLVSRMTDRAHRSRTWRLSPAAPAAVTCERCGTTTELAMLAQEVSA